MTQQNNLSRLEAAMNVLGLTFIASMYNEDNMAFFVCMVASLLVTAIMAVRIARQNRGHIWKSFIAHRDKPISWIIGTLFFILLFGQALIPEVAYEPTAWTSFALGLAMVCYNSIPPRQSSLKIQ